MERFYNCKNCMKTFKVSSVTEPSAQIPETKVSVTCPVCNTPNTVTLLGSQIYCCPAKVAHYSLLPRLDSTSRLSGSLIILRRKARIFGLASLQPGAAIWLSLPPRTTDDDNQGCEFSGNAAFQNNVRFADNSEATDTTHAKRCSQRLKARTVLQLSKQRISTK